MAIQDHPFDSISGWQHMTFY